MVQAIKCLVVDDEPLAARLISSYVERTTFLELAGTAANAQEATKRMRTDDVELLFLDIHMPGLSGIELAQSLAPGVRVIFTTAYADHAVDGFRVDAIDYLLKPISYEDFLESATRALREMRATTPPSPTTDDTHTHLVVKSEYRLLRIPISEIVYLEGLKDYVKIYMDGEQRPILTLISMKSIEETLAHSNFMRVHRSFIVNLDKVRVVERNGILLLNRSIPIGDTYRKQFLAAIGAL